MLAAWRDKLKNRKLNDQGSALVFVIIAIAFVGTLIAMLVYLVYFNYLMKYTDRAAKDNFYTAEAALAEVKAGIEREVSTAMVDSYYEVVSQHSDDTNLNQQAYFELAYRKNLEKVLGFESVSVPGIGTYTSYKPENIKKYWIETPIAVNAGDEGARVETPARAGFDMTTDAGRQNFGTTGPSVEYMQAKDEKGNTIDANVTVLKNVSISYTDADGYVSVITTDIAIETPELSFASVLSVPDIENYSLIAANSVTTGTQTDMVAANTVVTGNVFGGEEGIKIENDGQLKFAKKDGDPDTVQYTLTADTISAINGYRPGGSNTYPQRESILVDDVYNIWAKDIYVESANINLAANCYVKDDLTVDGIYSKVTLSGRYNGYGTATKTATSNSSILINGANTTLDFDPMKELNLAGHAYVGSTHYNANEEEDDYIDEELDEYNERVEQEIEEGIREEDTVSRNSADILMGQSLAVKSDQLMYMVPVECMGYDGDTQILGKNPMTIEEYNVLFGTYKPQTDDKGNTIVVDGEIQYTKELKYTPVRLDVVMNKVGASVNSYGATYTPVFRRINGTILVYFYLNFPSDDKANEFFRDYYNADKTAFNRYFKNYILDFDLDGSLSSSNQTLSVAGNMLYQRAGSGSIYLQEDTFDEELANFETIEATRMGYEDTFLGLTKYLMNSGSNLSSKQLKNTVYENLIIEEDKFAEIVPKGYYRTFLNEAGETVAVIVNNKDYAAFRLSDISSMGYDTDKIHLVIASGNVVVDVDAYDGLIISGDEISITAANRRIDYDPAEVSKALTAKAEIDGKNRYAFEVVVNGIAYANTLATTDADLLNAIENQKEDDIVRAADLVKFLNWTKE